MSRRESKNKGKTTTQQRTGAIVLLANISIVDLDGHSIPGGGIVVQKVADADAAEHGRLRDAVGRVGAARVAVEMDLRYRGVGAHRLGAGPCREGDHGS